MSADETPDRLDGPGSRPWRSDTCWNCLHLTVGTKTCLAFPEGIPDAVWQADRGHREPVPGDRGVQFLERTLPSPVLAERYEIPDGLQKPSP